MAVILISLLNKALYQHWVSCISRQNQQYWYKGLIFQASKIHNVPAPDANDIKNILSRNIIPFTHSFKCALLRL
jgi:hypothetical protein